MITRDDLAVEYGTGHWGGPTAKVTVNAGLLTGRVFTLNSTEGLTESSGKPVNLRNGGGIHVDGGDASDSRIDWRGVFRTLDMNKAIDSLVDYVNDLAERAAVQDATWGVIDGLSGTLTDFSESLVESSRREWREEWSRVCAAFVAARLKIEPYTDTGKAAAVAREHTTT